MVSNENVHLFHITSLAEVQVLVMLPVIRNPDFSYHVAASLSAILPVTGSSGEDRGGRGP